MTEMIEATRIRKDWGSSDAPTLHREGRKCLKCQHKVSRYQTPIAEKAILCYRCQRVMIDEDKSLQEFVGVRPTQRGKKQGVYLPNLKRIRRSQGYSAEHLGHVAGIHVRNVSKYENGKRASEKTVDRLARALGVSAGELRGE